MSIEVAHSLNESLESWHPASWGSAEISSSEYRGLRSLYRSLRSQIFGTDRRELSSSELDILRSTAIESIVTDGWPLTEHISLNDLSETAMLHACSVAGQLVVDRGVQATPDTIWSYTTKNQVHRFLTGRLRVHARTSGNYSAVNDWLTPAPRDFEHVTANVYIPAGVDDRYAYGVGKVECYWPAQLLRNLEAYRLGRAQLQGIPSETLKIPWILYDEVLGYADSAAAVARGIALQTMYILKDRHVPDESISSLIVAGYSPKGPITENGYLPEIGTIWQDLLSHVYYDPNVTGMYPILREGAAEKMLSVGYPSEYAPFINY